MDRTNRQEISPAYDPWESIHHRIAHGRDLLTSVEFYVTLILWLLRFAVKWGILKKRVKVCWKVIRIEPGQDIENGK